METQAAERIIGRGQRVFERHDRIEGPVYWLEGSMAGPGGTLPRDPWGGVRRPASRDLVATTMPQQSRSLVAHELVSDLS